MATQESTINSHGIEVFSSDWGYYTCDYETFCKIKKLHKYYHKSLSQSKAWFRWARKMEHNRKMTEPKTCPVFSEIVESNKRLPSVRKHSEKMGYSTSQRSAHSYWVSTRKGESYSYLIPDGYEPETRTYSGGEYTCMKNVGKNHPKSIVVRDFAIQEAYRIARMPVQDSEHVRRIPLSIKEIDAMLDEIENS